MLHTAGKDWMAGCLADRTGSRPAVADLLALSANVTAPVLADTALAGELNAVGGGLNRAQATYAHTNGSAVYTLTKTFTANASDALPVTVGKAGVFNATSGGVMPWSNLLSPTATLNAPGDAVTVTESINLS